MLQRVHDDIEQSFVAAQRGLAQGLQHSDLDQGELRAPEIWVSKWADWSNKYGLAYLLSNGCAGVYFNDSSKAVMNAAGSSFDYLERRGSNGLPGQRQSHRLEGYPAPLQKKVTLLKHFANYLLSKKAGEGEGEGAQPSGPQGQGAGSAESPNRMVYVKKWVRTKHAILFRLSDRTVQVIFYDHTEILLSSGNRVVTYTNKERRRQTYSLDTVFLNPKPDLAKRMKYTKDILFALLSQPRQQQQQQVAK